MVPKMFSAAILVLVLQVWDVCGYSGSVSLSQKSNKARQKRTLNFYFEYNSCYALAVVISLPLDLPSSRSVFFSYNFETNYYYPYFDNANGLVPLPFTQILEPGSNAGTKHRIDLPPGYRNFGDADDGKLENDGGKNKTADVADGVNKIKENVSKTTNVKKQKKSPSHNKQVETKKGETKSRKTRAPLNNYFMSRRRFFKMMESKMDRSGMKGRDCLLKAICETSEESFGQHNGVVGHVVDILFLPSASKDEKLPKRYYQAEANGRLRNCAKYDKACPVSIFEFISKKI